ncbi:MAG: DHH family phosphoesterase [Janthinobacterium lividum]
MATSVPASPNSSNPPLLLSHREEAIAALLPILRSHDRFLVTSHARPDGDAIGSALAAMHLLEAMGKQVTVVFADPVPRTFMSLPGTERIVHAQPSQPVEVALVLECDCVRRTGFDFLAADIMVNIDHHRSGTAYAAVNWIDPDAAAVGSMLYEIAVETGAPMSPAMATCLYAAILTDTVHFTLPSTTAETFGMAEHLVALGADAANIAEAVYHSYRPQRLWVLAAALSRFHIEGSIAWTAITQSEILKTGAETEDCEGVVNYVIGVAGVRAGFFLRELPTGQFRASLRSKGTVDVASVAERLGGGGHRNASGCTVEGPLDQACDLLAGFLRAAEAEAVEVNQSL